MNSDEFGTRWSKRVRSRYVAGMANAWLCETTGAPMKKFVCAAVVACVAFCLAKADEFTAVITKVEDGKVTFKKFNKDEKKFSDEQTLPSTASVKVIKGKFDKDTKKM